MGTRSHRCPAGLSMIRAPTNTQRGNSSFKHHLIEEDRGGKHCLNKCAWSGLRLFSPQGWTFAFTIVTRLLSHWAFQRESETSRGVLGGWNIPSGRIVFSPHTDEFVQVVRTQDRRVSRQVFEIIHDHSYEQVQHLQKEEILQVAAVLSCWLRTCCKPP